MLTKRGEGREGMWWLIDLLILLTITYFVFGYIDEVGEQTSFQKKYLANDVSLLIETLYAVPGSIYLEYPQDTLWFGMDISKNKVEVYEDRSDPPHLKASEEFIESPKIRFDYGSIEATEKPKAGFMEKYAPIIHLLRKEDSDKTSKTDVFFIKSQNEIQIATELSINGINNVKCSGDESFEYTFLENSENQELFSNKLLEEIANVVNQEIKVFDATIKILVRIISPTNNYVKVFYDANVKGLEEVACKIANELNQNIGGSVAIVPQNSFSLEKNAGLKSSPLIIIEIGTDNVNVDVIRDSIYTAIK